MYIIFNSKFGVPDNKLFKATFYAYSTSQLKYYNLSLFPRNFICKDHNFFIVTLLIAAHKEHRRVYINLENNVKKKLLYLNNSYKIDIQ